MRNLIKTYGDKLLEYNHTRIEIDIDLLKHVDFRVKQYTPIKVEITVESFIMPILA